VIDWTQCTDNQLRIIKESLLARSWTIQRDYEDKIAICLAIGKEQERRRQARRKPIAGPIDITGA
jgi:hypothetical protein